MSGSNDFSKKPDPAITYASLSDKGLQRTSNQDSYGVFPEDRFAFLEPKGQLFIVADGGGGWKERWRGKMGEVFLVAGKIKSTDSHSKNQNPMKSVILKMETNL